MHDLFKREKSEILDSILFALQVTYTHIRTGTYSDSILWHHAGEGGREESPFCAASFFLSQSTKAFMVGRRGGGMTFDLWEGVVKDWERGFCSTGERESGEGGEGGEGGDRHSTQ